MEAPTGGHLLRLVFNCWCFLVKQGRSRRRAASEAGSTPPSPALGAPPSPPPGLKRQSSSRRSLNEGDEAWIARSLIRQSSSLASSRKSLVDANEGTPSESPSNVPEAQAAPSPTKEPEVHEKS